MITTDDVREMYATGPEDEWDYNNPTSGMRITREARRSDFNEWLRNVQADAWDLGFIEGSSPDSDYVTFVEDADNPYRGTDE